MNKEKVFPRYIVIDGRENRYKLLITFGKGIRRCSFCENDDSFGYYRRYEKSYRICYNCIFQHNFALSDDEMERIERRIEKQIGVMDDWIRRHAYSKENRNPERLILQFEYYLEPEVWYRYANNRYIRIVFDIKQQCIICQKTISIEYYGAYEQNRYCKQCIRAQKQTTDRHRSVFS